MRSKTGSQVTVYATISDAPLALPDILIPEQDGHHDTAAPAAASKDMWALTQPPIGGCAKSHSGSLAIEETYDI